MKISETTAYLLTPIPLATMAIISALQQGYHPIDAAAFGGFIALVAYIIRKAIKSA